MSNYLIEGGNTSNKGAQAMLWVTIQEIQARDPDSHIVVSSSYDVKKHTTIPGVKIVAEGVDSKLCLKGGILKTKLKIKKIVRRLLGKPVHNLTISEKLLHKADILIDISGYTLSSNWDDEHNLAYLYMIEKAHQLGVKVYLMPQSFGPFNYQGKNSKRILEAINECLPCADIVFAREKYGENLLKQYAPSAIVRKSVDLVLQSKFGIIDSMISEDVRKLKINKDSVCIIPNEHCLTGVFDIYELYKSAINKLLQENYTVYLLTHAVGDKKICEKIKAMFFECPEVVYIKNDLNCFEFQYLVSKFNFVIASRYHSIVHSYKEGIPCVALGWAVKYKELLGLFGQDDYLVSTDSYIKTEDFTEIVSNMIHRYIPEKKNIREKLVEYQNNNCFSYISEGEIK